MRLLLHGGGVVHIGHRLAFSEPSNFVEFCRRVAGATPLGCRAAHAPAVSASAAPRGRSRPMANYRASSPSSLPPPASSISINSSSVAYSRSAASAPIRASSSR
jgi:AraC-like DNA-binding protein